MKRFAIAGAISLALIFAAHAQAPTSPGAGDGTATAHDVAAQWTALTIIQGNFAKAMSALMQDYQRVETENANLKAELDKLKTAAQVASPPPAVKP